MRRLGKNISGGIHCGVRQGRWKANGLRRQSRFIGIHLLDPPAPDYVTAPRKAKPIYNPKGCEKVAGGRSAAETTGTE